ncbi:hypothetical protein [Rhizobium sp. RAF56]|uniref:hypothetical protein n=1 Tax=Rhizobium sp. RAF56 TaxID=3233062 RepID=UPI003F9763F5
MDYDTTSPPLTGTIEEPDEVRSSDVIEAMRKARSRVLADLHRFRSVDAPPQTASRKKRKVRDPNIDHNTMHHRAMRQLIADARAELVRWEKLENQRFERERAKP